MITIIKQLAVTFKYLLLYIYTKELYLHIYIFIAESSSIANKSESVQNAIPCEYDPKQRSYILVPLFLSIPPIAAIG